jgi:quinoprotein glucose dehydrogenase
MSRKIAAFATLVILSGTALLGSYEAERDVPYVPGVDVVEWPTADGFEGNHFSPLADIQPQNVHALQVAWSYRTGDWGTHEDGLAGMSFEATPLMVDGVLYVVTPASRAVALDAETGEELWTFAAGIDPTDQHHVMTTSRGLSHWRDPEAAKETRCSSRIVMASFDARLFSLDARTGRPCPEFGEGGTVDLGIGIERIEGRRHMFKQTAPPAVIDDLIVVGSSILDGHFVDAPSGAVRAFDARSGALRWSWEPLVHVHRRRGTSDAISAGAAASSAATIGAANTWATITPDPDLGLLFVPTGSPSPDHYGGLRPGDNRYANSLVALEAETGQVVWHFQTVHHDLWDYDLPAPPTLLTLSRDGAEVPVVVQTTKTGHVFVFDRRTGEPFFPIVEMPVPASDVPGERTSPTQPIPTLPPPLVPQRLDSSEAWGLTPWDRAACRRRMESHRNEGVFTPPSLRGSVAFPGFIGGMEWGGVAFDAASGLLVTNTNRLAMVATLVPREVADTLSPPGANAKYAMAPQRGTPYAARREPLLSPLGIPCTPPPWGMLHAVHLQTGQVVWEVPLGSIRDLTKVPTPWSWGSPNLGGPLVTGGLIFIGASMDRGFRAFDLATGELLWRMRLPASVQSTAMTYRARPRGRQYVVVTAGGHDGLGSSLGDHVIAFALPLAREVER